jgi:hypothetical protein
VLHGKSQKTRIFYESVESNDSNLRNFEGKGAKSPICPLFLLPALPSSFLPLSFPLFFLLASLLLWAWMAIRSDGCEVEALVGWRGWGDTGEGESGCSRYYYYFFLFSFCFFFVFLLSDLMRQEG